MISSKRISICLYVNQFYLKIGDTIQKYGVVLRWCSDVRKIETSAVEPNFLV